MAERTRAKPECSGLQTPGAWRVTLLLWATLVGACDSETPDQSATGGSSGAPQGGTSFAGATPASAGQGVPGGSPGGGTVSGVAGAGGTNAVAGTSAGSVVVSGSASGGAAAGGGVTVAGMGGSGGASGNATSGGSLSGSGGVRGGSGGAAGSGGGLVGTGGQTGVDECPSDPAKTAPGVCGCGVSEACAVLKQGLVHRYAFTGTGTVAEDSVGDADGTVMGTVLSGSGSVVLNGNDQFVNLPNGLISVLRSATFEAWATVGSGIGTYSHVLDFGSSTGQEGAQGSGRSFLFLAPGSSVRSDPMRAAISLNGASGESIVDAAFIPDGVLTHMAIVIDDPADRMLMYRNGTLQGSVSVATQLAMIADVNNWLGRSQFASDADFKGSIDEFRIYNVALTAADLQLSATAGPSPAFLQP